MTTAPKLAIVLLGEQNSGKSSSWYALFGEEIRTGKYQRHLSLGVFSTDKGDLIDGEVKVKVFIINGSPEESDVPLEKKMSDVDPQIVLTSVQYSLRGFDSIQYLKDNGFDLKVIWINPGANVNQDWPYADYEGFANRIIYLHGGELTLMPSRKGQADANSKAIAQAIREKVLGWAVYNVK